MQRQLSEVRVRRMVVGLSTAGSIVIGSHRQLADAGRKLGGILSSDDVGLRGLLACRAPFRVTIQGYHSGVLLACMTFQGYAAVGAASEQECRAHTCQSV